MLPSMRDDSPWIARHEISHWIGSTVDSRVSDRQHPGKPLPASPLVARPDDDALSERYGIILIGN
jgi:hypothetical protein